MGILDSNRVHTQGRTLKGTILSNVTGISDYSENKIDCRGFNSLVIGAAPFGVVTTEIRLVGYYPDNTNTALFKPSLDGVEITGYPGFKDLVRRTVSKIETGYYNRYMIDVSDYDWVGVGKLLDDGSSVYVNYELSQKLINISEYPVEKFTTYAKTTSLLSKNSFFITVDGHIQTNAICFKLHSDGERTVRAFKVTHEGTTQELTSYSYNVLSGFVLSSATVYAANKTYYFVVPIDIDASRIYLDVPNPDSDNIDVEYSYIDFDFEKDDKVELSDNPFSNTDFLRFFSNSKMEVYEWTGERKFAGLLRDVAVWYDSLSIGLSISGVNGQIQEIIFNEFNFPNLIANSMIERVILMPWTRNADRGYGGYQWRMNVITNKGQVYHNFPSREIDSDGLELPDDYMLFDESVVWELPERWTPVKSDAGNDAALIATGKYKYFPCLPDEAYEMHPPVNSDNGYGNGGFAATVTKQNEEAQDITFGRYYFTDRSRGYDGNPLGFMGGFIANEKISMLATYKSNNQSTGGTRMCVFFTNDGGRNWFCRYEFGANGELIDGNDALLSAANTTFLPRNLVSIGMTDAPAGIFQVVKRSQYTPSSAYKEIEKTKKFKYASPVLVSSIVDNGSEIIVNTSDAHGLNDGEVILFEKQNAAPVNDWDWITNAGHDSLSSGDGVLFKAQYISATSFRLMECIYNPDNNLKCRHIHSANRGKDHITFGCGETYPEGWMFYIPFIASDSYYRHYPWDSFSFIRLNSSPASVQRPLGFFCRQDADNTIYVGVDNENTELGNVALPEGRSDTFRRSSQGVFRARLVDVDSFSSFECIFESKEVCYLFKEVYGRMIYIGQNGHIGISTDGGKTWSEANLNKGDVSRYGGISSKGFICIDNYLIVTK